MATEELTADGKVTGPRGAKAFKRWEPKKWLPVYEAIVALSCTGLSNEEVGKRFGYGKQQVSNILNTPQGKKLIEIMNERIRTNNANTLTERIERMQDKAMKHVEAVLDMPTDNFKNPLQIFDASLAFLKSSSGGKIAPESAPSNQPQVSGGNTYIKTAMILNGDQAKQLNDGLRLADQVKVIHGDSRTDK